MKTNLIFLIQLVISLNLYSQGKIEQSILEEGKKLYKSEMASWYGTDLFMEKFKDKVSRIGG